jgi:cob(I)alamin adenosyltransferase
MTVQMIVALVAVLAPLVGVPLSAITFYLRALKEHNESRSRDTAGRLRALEEQSRGLQKMVEDVERDFTTKEEWLRESMLARQQLERLTEMVARLQARLEDGEGLIGHMAKAADAMVELARALAGTR